MRSTQALRIGTFLPSGVFLSKLEEEDKLLLLWLWWLLLFCRPLEEGEREELESPVTMSKGSEPRNQEIFELGVEPLEEHWNRILAPAKRCWSFL